MKVFRCTVFNPNSGKKEKINICANDKNEAAMTCIEKNLSVSKIQCLKKSRRKANEELLDFTRTIEEFVGSGMSIKDSLESCRSFYSDIILSHIKKGGTFSSSILELEGKVPNFYLASLKTADAAGSLKEIFPRLREYLEMRKSIREKISATLVYPSIVLILATVMLTGTVVYIIPKIKEIFSTFGNKGCEEIEKNISELESFAAIVASIILFFSTAVSVLRFSARRKTGIKEHIDSFLLKMPVIGTLIIENETMNFAFAMETLSKSGIPIEKSMENSAGILKNLKLKEKIMQIVDDLKNGSKIAGCFRKTNIFPEYVCRQLEISEHSADSKNAFRQIKLHFKSRIERKTKLLMTLIEPAVMILTGTGMITIILKVIIPIFNLYGDL